MKIRVYETDYEGNPVKCTGEYFIGENALAIVEAMKMNPFQSALTVHKYIQKVLSQIDQKEFILSSDPAIAAMEFLQRLTALGYADFELDDNEFNDKNPIQAENNFFKN